jgi:asparagine synthase (glutamine-hydrolysing)
LYEEHGIGCVHHLRGMFAFALWDAKLKRLLLVRDRMGEKPLYLWEGDGILCFASELRALLKGLSHKPEIDPVSIDLYFHFGYVPEPLTPLERIYKLPAGHLLIADTTPWHIRQQQYWDMLNAPPLEGDPVADIRTELDAISQIIIRADVPVGVALSGGLDSSAIAALAVRRYSTAMHAFSVGYPGRPSNDERADAKALADFLKMPFHEVELATDQLVHFFPDLVCYSDDPIPDISAYGYYAVNRLAQEHNVPVLLQGHGGDELFWGYPWVRKATMASLAKKRANQTGNRLRRFWHSLRQHYVFADTLVFMDSRLDFQVAAEWKANQLYTVDFATSLTERTPYEVFAFAPPWKDVPVMMTNLICKTYLLENGIVQGDRLSMASSVELRLPLVDYRLVEVIIGHRKTKPDHKLPPKTWLQRAMEGILPEWVIYRPKVGFAPPVRSWYEALHATYGTYLDGGYLVQAGVLSAGRARALAEGKDLQRGVKTMPFKALCLELWCRGVLAG